MAQTHYDHATDHLESVLRQFLSNYKYIYEKRLQNVMFWFDYNYALEHGEPYTDAHYYKYMYGAFSPEIRYVLQEIIEPPTDTVRVEGVRVPKYICYVLDTESDPVCDPAIVQWAFNNTKSTTTADLIEENSSTTVYESATFGHQLNLDTLAPQPDVVSGGRKRGTAPHTEP